MTQLEKELENKSHQELVKMIEELKKANKLDNYMENIEVRHIEDLDVNVIFDVTEGNWQLVDYYCGELEENHTRHYVTEYLNKSTQVTERPYSDYAAFLFSDMISQNMYHNDSTCDEVWENCVELARDFEGSDYDLDTKSLYDCVYDFADAINLLGKFSK